MFKRYNMMFQYMQSLHNDQIRITSISLDSTVYDFLLVTTIQILFSGLEVYNTLLSAMDILSLSFHNGKTQSSLPAFSLNPRHSCLHFLEGIH